MSGLLTFVGFMGSFYVFSEYSSSAPSIPNGRMDYKYNSYATLRRKLVPALTGSTQENINTSAIVSEYFSDLKTDILKKIKKPASTLANA